MNTLETQQSDTTRKMWSTTFKRFDLPFLLEKPYPIAVRPICEYLGLDWTSEFGRIQLDPYLSDDYRIFSVTDDDDMPQDMVFLPALHFFRWLTTLDASHVRTEERHWITKLSKDLPVTLFFGFAKNVELLMKNRVEELNEQWERTNTFYFSRFPHWVPIRECYRKYMPFKAIAEETGKAVSVCRFAIKRMEAIGLLTDLEISVWKAANRRRPSRSQNSAKEQQL